jgi:hypothetical protein
VIDLAVKNAEETWKEMKKECVKSRGDFSVKLCILKYVYFINRLNEAW